MNAKYTTIEDKVQSDYDVLAEAFSASRRGMRWAELDAMIEELRPGDKILDVGCGTGRLYAQTRSKQVDYTGVDISPKQLEMARQQYTGGKFLRASMVDLPFKMETFDAVFHIAALHHLPTEAGRRKALAEAARVLAPDGKLYLTVKAFWRPSFWNLFLNKSDGKATLTKTELLRLRWNDVFWPWSWGAARTVHRYYHAFTRRELKRLLKNLPLAIERIDYVQRGQSAPFYRADNLVCVARKVIL